MLFSSTSPTSDRPYACAARHGRLAWAETWETGGLRQLVQPFADLRLNVGSRDHHLKMMFQTFGRNLRDLHERPRNDQCRRPGSATDFHRLCGRLAWCGRGIEPSRVSPQEPKSCVSTNSTTSATSCPSMGVHADLRRRLAAKVAPLSSVRSAAQPGGRAALQTGCRACRRIAIRAR